MVRKNKLFIVAFQILGLGVWAQGPIQVVTTTGMIGDVAQQVVGTCGRVDTLMGPGTDPHAYTATNADVTALRNADLILYNGLGLEGSLAEVLAALRDRGHDLEVAKPWSVGRLTAACRNPDGLLRAAATPRLMQAYAVGR